MIAHAAALKIFAGSIPEKVDRLPVVSCHTRGSILKSPKHALINRRGNPVAFNGHRCGSAGGTAGGILSQTGYFGIVHCIGTVSYNDTGCSRSNTLREHVGPFHRLFRLGLQGRNGIQKAGCRRIDSRLTVRAAGRSGLGKDCLHRSDGFFRKCSRINVLSRGDRLLKSSKIHSLFVVKRKGFQRKLITLGHSRIGVDDKLVGLDPGGLEGKHF